MSQVFTTPSESHVMTIPSFACKVIDLMLCEVGSVDSGSVITGSDGVPVCQNLIDWSSDAEMREEGEENVRELTIPVCAMVSIR